LQRLQKIRHGFYHAFFAVNAAMAETIRDKKAELWVVFIDDGLYIGKGSGGIVAIVYPEYREFYVIDGAGDGIIAGVDIAFPADDSIEFLSYCRVNMKQFEKAVDGSAGFCGGGYQRKACGYIGCNGF
jgi:hypothetical protein